MIEPSPKGKTPQGARSRALMTWGAEGEQGQRHDLGRSDHQISGHLSMTDLAGDSPSAANLASVTQQLAPVVTPRERLVQLCERVKSAREDQVGPGLLPA
jgi:hypothetical protein